MNGIDVALVILLLLCGLRGSWRGVFRESFGFAALLLGLLGWFVWRSAVVSKRYEMDMAQVTDVARRGDQKNLQLKLHLETGNASFRLLEGARSFRGKLNNWKLVDPSTHRYRATFSTSSADFDGTLELSLRWPSRVEPTVAGVSGARLETARG